MTTQRLGDRPPSYIPKGPARDHMLTFSKADLAELVWDYALRTVGEDRIDGIIQEIDRTASYLDAYHQRRTPVFRAVLTAIARCQDA